MTTPILAAALFGACCLSQWYRGSVEATDRALGGSDDLAVARARLASSAEIAQYAARNVDGFPAPRSSSGSRPPTALEALGAAIESVPDFVGPTVFAVGTLAAVVGIAVVSVEALVVVTSAVVPLLFVAHLSR